MNKGIWTVGPALGDPYAFDWRGFLQNPRGLLADAELWDVEQTDRLEDLAELRWLLGDIRKELQLYREAFPDGPFERELAAAYARQTDKLQEQVDGYEREPSACDLNAFLAVKYDIRTLRKQLGATVAGSDWQSPCIRLKPVDPEVPEEAGFAQEERGTYMRSYGSEAVKAYEESSLSELYRLPAELRDRSAIFLTTSGMQALELALVAYKTQTGETLPFYYQEGFYCEGVDLAAALIDAPVMLRPDAMYAKLEANEPIGCLLVDPGRCWPIRPAVDLERLFEGLAGHRQDDPLYVIVDRTLTGLANPLFERYADRLPPHVVLISVESGIKYMQYGLELANVGYVVAVDRRLEGEEHRKKWVSLLALLDAGADPIIVRQLPEPDAARLTTRLSRLNRNAHWMNAFLDHLVRAGRIDAFHRSVDPSPQFQLAGQPWIGSLFYIRLSGGRTEPEYQAWIDAFVASAPDEAHFVSGGSFGFDTFRMNSVTDPTQTDNALRVSVGRDPLGQLLAKLAYLYNRLG